ncbi:hypothetical protein V9N52_003694 [Vibrio navarrensis]
MKYNLFFSYTVSATILTAISSPAIGSSYVWENISKSSVDGAGRNIMRTAQGGIVAAFAIADGGRSELTFSRSLDNGESWNNIYFNDTNGTIRQVAIDSNFQGSYIAFTKEENGVTTGHIAYTTAPFSTNPSFIVSQTVTPESVEPHDTFIQASRKGWGNQSDENRATIVYGWQDRKSKNLYIGVSKDGHSFPVAKKVVTDSYATSGPAVAIRGNYVIATYQTTNPDFAPKDVSRTSDTKNSYPAWLESMDGGKTWTEPKPLFGLTTSDFPTAKVKNGLGEYNEIRLAGGTYLPNSPILNWSASAAGAEGTRFTSIEDKTLSGNTESRQVIKALMEKQKLEEGGTTFVQTSMKGLEGVDSQVEVSIVSFRSIEPNAKWHHVIANNQLTTEKNQQNAKTSKLDVEANQFQYSALIDTPIRATTYKEYDPKTDKARIVAAVSDDTGKTFDKHFSFSHEDLSKYGLHNFDENSIFAASQCLFEDRDGEVYIDLVVTEGSSMRFISIPIGVNAEKIRSESKLAINVKK